jgi:hypothetical protein
MNARILLAVLLGSLFAGTDACGQFNGQPSRFVPPRDRNQRTLLGQRVVYYASPAARSSVESREYLPPCEPEAVCRSEAPVYYSGSDFAPHYVNGNTRLSKQESLMLGAVLLAALGVYLWWKRRRQYCDSPA